MTFNFTDLILLVGTNPLPNFVVSDFFLQKNQSLQNIWLIYSEEYRFQSGTSAQADNLESLLNERWETIARHEIKINKIAIPDVGDANCIRREVRAKILNNLQDNSVLHLNYTGGTKTMSTQVYVLVKESERSHTEFSYLDARSFNLKSDSGEILANDTRKFVQLSFNEMIKLHGFNRNNEPGTFHFEDTLPVFQSFIEEGKLNEFFDREKGYKRDCFVDDKGNLITKTGKLNPEIVKSWVPNTAILAINSALPTDYQLFDQNKEFNWGIQNEEFKKVIKFIDGEWLEHYCYGILKSNIPDKFKSIDIDWVITKRDWSNDVKFQIDLLFINGYQLFGISCTTDSKLYLCKSKGFEIIHRTRQIGGDEAKAILITGLNEPNRIVLEEQLIVDTGVSSNNILVLGEKQLKKDIFWEKIKEFCFIS